MKYREISAEELPDLLESIEGCDADALWLYVCGNGSQTTTMTYEQRKQYFLSIMHHLMNEGRLKIAYRRQFWEGTIEEQLQRYSDRWPKDERMLDSADFQLTKDSSDGTLYYWAQGGFVWVCDDGFMEWT
ncbi:DUF596 domain-containing protein [Advenella mimigardefordensis]|uniref:DUF596 domain-containing protein n=1 Tax=Advenella mimigardefordensis TaxID=302406 RepID=UPI00046D74EB|nr:DUF596 domain-containing protein [Advenella mimigardefordensis]